MSPQLIAALVIAGASFAGGWVVNGWKHDSAELVAQKAADKAAEQFKDAEKEIAQAVEAKLAGLKMGERVIDRGIVREVIKNEIVYRNVCITDDGRMLVNQIAKGRTAASEPIAEVRRRVADSRR